MDLAIFETNESNSIFELLAPVSPHFDKNRVRYDFSKFTYQMKIARFSSKMTPKNKKLLLNGNEFVLELQMKVVEDFNTEF